MSEKKESRISEVSPEEDDFRIYCKRVGIPESQLMAARDVFDALVEAVLNLFARASGQALPEGLDVLLGRNCTTQPAAPSSSTLQALDAAVKDEIRRSLRPLATRMRLHDFKVLESELLEYPLSPPVGAPAPKAVMTLAYLGALVTPTNEFNAYAERLELGALARAMLLGVLNATLTPWPWPGLGESFRKAYGDPVTLAKLMRGTLPDEKLNVVVAGIHACSRSDGDKNDPLLAVARAQFHEDHSMHFPNPDATERVGVAGADFFCPNPFTYAQTNPGAKINVCSPCLLPQSIGTLHLDGIGAIWKSDVAKQIRASILDGSFRYCDASQCRALRLGTLPKRGTTATDTLMAECLAAAAEGPTTVALVFGDRGGGEPGDMFSARQSMMENAMAEIPGSVRRVIFGGTAEPLENDYFLTFLREFDPGSRPSLRITLRTNGLALTPALWESLCHASIDTVEVRCDAATPATFALNGSGDFTLLSDNLRALGHECAAGRLEQLCLAFTVQVNNFREMPDFIAFARNSGATCIRFQELQDPGTWAPGEFRRRAVSRPEHPQHLELVSMLRQECFAAPDIDLTDLSDLMHSDNLGENRK